MTLNTIHCGDAVEYLKSLPDNAVNCVVTSPPYYGLRDYGVDGQIGLEGSVGEYLANLHPVFQEVYRVLRDDGVLWLNMGDSYTGGGRGSGSGKQTTNKGSLINTRSADLPAKNLLGVPWRLAFALQDDGWILRSDCIWHKPSVMPESVTDRPTKSHEYVFLLTKSPRYWYDADAVREPAINDGRTVTLGEKSLSRGQARGRGIEPSGNGKATSVTVAPYRNIRTVWTLSAEPNAFAHFAAFPQKLVRRCILAGCPREVCAGCGAPYVREVEKTGGTIGKSWHDHSDDMGKGMMQVGGSLGEVGKKNGNGYQRIDRGFSPTCTCNASTRPGVVLDPFMGIRHHRTRGAGRGKRLLGVRSQSGVCGDSGEATRNSVYAQAVF